MVSDFFYSTENDEPAHIHIKKENASGKIWIDPVLEICYLHDFTNAEEKEINRIIKAGFKQIKTKWYEYFNK